MRDMLGAVKYQIPVYLVAPNSTFINLDRDAVAHLLDVAIENWNEQGFANFRPYFAGIVASKSGLYNGKVYIIETTSFNTCGGHVCAVPQYSGANRVGTDIFLYKHPDPTHWNYTRVDPVFNPAKEVLYNRLVHELGHAWGIKDEYSLKCENPDPVSVMAENCYQSTIVARRDVSSLGVMYGQRAGKSYSYTRSPDAGNSWQFGGTSSVISYAHAGSIGTSPNDPGSVFAQAMANATTSPTVRTQAIVGWPEGIPIATTPWATDLSRSWDVAAAARKNSSSYAVAFRHNESEYNCKKRTMVFVTTNNGSTWTGWQVTNGDGSINESSQDGVSLAYSPEVDAYVVAIMIDGDVPQALFQVIDAASPHVRGPGTVLSEIWSNNHPSIACNNYFYTNGTYGCIVAWTSASRWSTVNFLYADIRTDPVFGLKRIEAIDGPYDTGFISTQPPSVAPQARTDYPWIMTTKLPAEIYSVRYDRSLSWWVDSRVVASSSAGLLAGAAGAQLGSAGLQLIVQYLVQ